MSYLFISKVVVKYDKTLKNHIAQLLFQQL
jgi:hypothetical protein